MPPINVSRYGASSCLHRGYIYLFGGRSCNDGISVTDDNMMPTNQIERLNLSFLRDYSPHESENVGWELFVPDDSVLIPREDAAMMSYDDGNFIVLGGRGTT